MSKSSIIIAAYLLLVNLLAFVIYGIDKKRAMQKRFRIPERTLLWMARLGGGVGSWLGIKLFRHKTKHARFRILVPLWILIWLVGIVLALFYLQRLLADLDLVGITGVFAVIV